MSLPSAEYIKDRLANLRERDILDGCDASISAINDQMNVAKAEYRIAARALNEAIDRECDAMDKEFPGWRDVLFNQATGKA